MMQLLGRRLRYLENVLLLLFFLIMVVLAVAQIILRLGHWGGLYWADDFLRVEVLWLAMLGAVVAARDRHHLGLDLIRRFLPVRQGQWVERGTSLLTAVIAASLAFYCGQFVQEERGGGSFAFANVPVWWAEGVLPVGFGLIALHYLRHVLWYVPREEQT